MDLGRMDLNLLRVFGAVFEERNLIRAGKRLHLSQSAVSHALARLRENLHDELFVRTARGMEPTARALVMSAPLRDALQRIEDTLGVMPFVPATASRQFVIAANDYVTAVLLSRLSLQLESIAPAIQMVIRPSTRLDLAEQIDLGRIDIAIGIFAEIPARFQSLPAWTQKEAMVMRKGHPAGRRKVHMEDLARFPLVTLSVGGQEEGAVSGFIVERGLARQSEMYDRHALQDAVLQSGVTPRIRITVCHSMVIPALLRGSDMIAIVPSPLAHEFMRSRDVLQKDLPYAASSSTVRAVWHGRSEHDPGHVWLREQIVQATQALQEP